MSDVPDKIMKAAMEAYESLSVACISSRPIDFRAEDIVIVARALMAAAEAATKRERERCAEIASDFDWTGAKGDPRTGDVMPSAVCEDIAAAILKGET